MRVSRSDSSRVANMSSTNTNRLQGTNAQRDARSRLQGTNAGREARSHRACRRLERVRRLEGRASVAVALSFAEIDAEHHYRVLGFTSMLAYAMERLEMSASRCHQLRGLSERMREFPALRDAMASGRLSWTKARAIAPILTASSADAWIGLASRLSRRELEQRIADARGAARRAVGGGAQETIRVDPVPAKPSSRGDAAASPTIGAADVARAADEAIAADLANADSIAVSGAGADAVADSAAAVDSAAGTNSTVADDCPSVADSVADVDSVAGVGDAAVTSAPTLEVTLELRVRLDTLSHAHAEAAWEHARKHGFRGSKAEFVVAAMAMFANALSSGSAPRSTSAEAAARSTAPSSSSPSASSSRVPPSSPASASSAASSSASCSTPSSSSSAMVAEAGPRSCYQIVVQDCPTCHRARVGDRPLNDVMRRAILADADVVDARGRRRASIAPSLRRRVLARDEHRCRVPGCNSRHHLAVHHRLPVERGGRNTMENLATVCWRCHAALHAMPVAAAREVWLVARRRE